MFSFPTALEKGICLLVCALIFSANTSLTQPYYFKHYEVEDGLANNRVLCSLQDSKGFMWFGTVEGLCRFDGYVFKTFQKNKLDSTALHGNYINCLYEDANEQLWVGTAEGLHKYNAGSENFSLLSGTEDKFIRDVTADKAGNLWFIASIVSNSYDNNAFTLFRYNTTAKIFRSYKKEVAEPTSICTGAGTIWVSTSLGLLKKYDESQDGFIAYDVCQKNASSIYVETIYNTGNNSLLISVRDDGIKVFDIAAGSCKDFLNFAIKTKITAKEFAQYSANEFWVATERDGVFICNTKTNKVTHLLQNYNNPYSISDNTVFTICKDREGGIWIGTLFGGINYYSSEYSTFQKFFPHSGANSSVTNVVSDITEDTDGNLWIGTPNAGVNKLNVKSCEFKNFGPASSLKTIPYSTISGLLAVGNELWIGTLGNGILKMNIKTEKVTKHYTQAAGKISLKDKWVVYFYLSTSKDLFAGTWKGLYKYNTATDSFYLVHGFAFETLGMVEDKELFWIGTRSNGVFTLNKFTGEINHIVHNENDTAKTHSLVNNGLNDIFLDSDKNLWFATGEGLSKYNPAKKSFKNYTIKNGLPTNFILDVLEDNKKNIWISTTKGLVSLNPVSDSLKIYTTGNGLLSDQFSYNSSYKDKKGKLYFGSVKGLISFYPEDFTSNNFIPPVYLTGFQVNNKELLLNEENSPLKNAITHTDTIILKHNQATFSIDFAALSYKSPLKNEYAYKMDGLDNEWTYLKTNRKIYYTGLSPRTYTFKVKASNSSGVWNTEERTLVIKILPPVWASTWAYWLYAAMILLIVYLTIRYYYNRTVEKNKRKMELLEHEKEKEIYNAKIEFFTNVAHEVKTPLTLIKGPMEKIMRKSYLVPEMKKNFELMERNTNRLLELTSQLLDFRKTEINGFSLNFVETDIHKLLCEVYCDFKILAEEKNLDYTIDLPKNYLAVYVDLDAINKILFNLFSNAIKYAHKIVRIKLLPFKKGDTFFIIEVENDGYLIPYEMKEKVFEPFFRIKGTEAQKGTGIGLSLSRSLAQLHKGDIELKPNGHSTNVFALTLPVHQEKEFNLYEQKREIVLNGTSDSQVEQD